MTGQIQTKYGAVHGVETEAGTVFRGIPYAKPPIGDLRFRPPQPMEHWEGVRDCDRFPPMAMQKREDPDSFYGKEFFSYPEFDLPMSEDCLYLNIWMPQGADRLHIRMPEGHNELISAVCAANPNTVVVLHNGSPVEMPWVNEPRAILEAYLGGEGVGEAELSALYGDVNPSGHLAETFPKKLSDNPSYLSYHGEGNVVKYQEGVFIGYRYYTSKEMDVLFPFGHGLSYTSFAYSDLRLNKTTLREGETLTASVTVTNTGSRAGKALVQLYVAPQHVEIIRPVRELKGFEKVELQPGESREVSFTLDRRAFAHWNITVHDWCCERGRYDIQICENAHSVLLSETVTLDVPTLLPTGGYTEGVPMGMLAATEKGRAFLDENIIFLVRGMVAAGYIPAQILQLADSIPGGLTIGTMEMISQRSGHERGVGGATGLDALLGQPTSVLKSFLPKEKKKELSELMEELNQV